MERRKVFLSIVAVSLILLYQASSIGLVQVYSKEKEHENEDGKHATTVTTMMTTLQGNAGKQSAGTTTNSFTSTATTVTGAHEDEDGKHSGGHSDAANTANTGNSGKQVEIHASGKVVAGRLQGANVNVEVNAKFAPDGTFQEGQINVKIQQADTKAQLILPASPGSHLHPPTSGDHTSIADCPVPNPSAHIVSTATGLNIQIIGGTSTANVALQGLSPILGTYSDVLCLSGATQIAGK